MHRTAEEEMDLCVLLRLPSCRVRDITFITAETTS